MLENITLGHIATGLVFLLGIWGSVEAIGKKVSKVFDDSLDTKLKPLNDKLDKVDKNATMNYLVRCFGDLDKGEKLEGVYRKRFIEQYQHYTDDLKGNSYIKEEYERLKKEGKL